jgi:hypothetical protein
MARIARVDQQIARRMPDKDTSCCRANGKAAEGFSSLEPAGGEPGQRRNSGRNTRMRCSQRQRRSPKVEEVKGRADRHSGDQEEKQKPPEPFVHGRYRFRGAAIE